MKLLFLNLFLVTIAYRVPSQNLQIAFEYQKNILKKNEYQKLDTLAKYIIKNEIKHINLTNYPCDEELKKNPAIGALRSISIIDYMQKKYQIYREIFFYIDSHPSRINKKNCGEEITGIIVSTILR